MEVEGKRKRLANSPDIEIRMNKVLTIISDTIILKEYSDQRYSDIRIKWNDKFLFYWKQTKTKFYSFSSVLGEGLNCEIGDEIN